MKIEQIAKVKALFRLFRWENLLMMILMMVLVRYGIIHAFLKPGIQAFPLSHPDFIILMLSVVFIASGGYIINDYFDVKMDRINRPDSMVLGKHLRFSTAIALHQVFSFLGILAGFYAGYRVGSIQLGGIQAVTVALLWFYSFRYKRLLLWGNLVIALLSGLLVCIVWLFEFYSLRSDALAFAGAFSGFRLVNRLITGYFLFSFLLTLAREITKDVQDVEGDRQQHCNTLAVRLGTSKAMRIVSMILGFTLLLLVCIQIIFLYRFSILVFWYSLLLIDLPLLYLIILILRKKDNLNLRLASRYLKVMMLTGILSMVFLSV